MRRAYVFCQDTEIASLIEQGCKQVKMKKKKIGGKTQKQANENQEVISLTKMAGRIS